MEIIAHLFTIVVVVFMIVVVVVGLQLVGKALGYGVAAAKAAKNTAQGSGSFKDNFGLELRGMGAMELRGIEKEVGDGSSKMKIIELEVRGLFPITGSRNAAFVTSILDKTDGDKKWKSVVSAVHQFQEPKTNCYQNVVNVGEIKGGYGFPRWVRIGVVLRNVLQPARTGTRPLIAICRLIDINDPPSINNGFQDSNNNAETLWIGTHNFNLKFTDAGYLDELSGKLSCAIATVQLAVVVSMADGEFHNREGEIIKGWIQRKLTSIDEAEIQAWKSELNEAFKTAYDQATKGSLTHSSLIEVLNSDSSSAHKIECVDLLFSIVAADGSVTAAEVSLAKKIASALNVDVDEVKRIADRSLVSVHAEVSSDADLEELLGIASSWTADVTRKHLRDEFQRWNNRLMALTDPAERETAQRMLNLIAEARKKYQ